jgi:leucyl-tRNA synthetase
VVEPGTLVRRFGADALRLGYLLALSAATSSEVVTLAESHLRRARRAVHALSAKVTGLAGLVRAPLRVGRPRSADRWIVARCAAAAQAARAAYESHQAAQAAERLVEAIDDFVRYANAAAARRKEGGDLGAVRGATALAIAELAPAFSPLCPYLFAALERWIAERFPAAERDWDGMETESSAAERDELERITTGTRVAVEA